MSRKPLPRRAPTTPKPTTARLKVEALEGRLVPATPITDMTELARSAGFDWGTNTIWVNFDGTAAGTPLFGQTARAFAGTEADKAEILFRVSEIFAPFNVEVRRMHGAGSHDQSRSGATTVFVGDNDTLDSGMGVDQAGGFTPAVFGDGPLNGRTSHRPNSGWYDLCFVDPQWFDPAVNGTAQIDNLSIAQTAAHEIAHTYGLVHVLSSPTNDVMSYNSTNAYFSDQTYAITTLNADPLTGVPKFDPAIQPRWWYGTSDTGERLEANVTTQNSFTYLREILRERGTHEPFVVNRGSVDQTAYTNFEDYRSAIGGQDVTALLGMGEYHTYTVQADDWDRTMRIDVSPTNGEWAYLDSLIIPQVMIFTGTDATPRVLEATYAAPGRYEIHFEMPVTDGEVYHIVVSDLGTNDRGGYRLRIRDAGPQLDPTIPGPDLNLGEQAEEANPIPDPIGPVAGWEEHLGWVWQLSDEVAALYDTETLEPWTDGSIAYALDERAGYWDASVVEAVAADVALGDEWTGELVADYEVASDYTSWLSEAALAPAIDSPSLYGSVAVQAVAPATTTYAATNYLVNVRSYRLWAW